MTRVARLLLAALLLLAGGRAAPAEAADARRAMAEGFELFARGSLDPAARSFERAAAAAADEGLDPATAVYARGCAFLKAGKVSEAAAAFAEASRSPDRDLRAKADYNRAVALATAAGAAETAGALEAAIGLFDQALGSLESAMRADPRDEDPKVNHELIMRKRAQLEQKMRGRERQEGGGGQPPPPVEQQGEARPRSAPQGRPGALGSEMRPEEARTMLDAMRQQEMTQRSRIRPPGADSASLEKAW